MHKLYLGGGRGLHKDIKLTWSSSDKTRKNSSGTIINSICHQLSHYPCFKVSHEQSWLLKSNEVPRAVKLAFSNELKGTLTNLAIYKEGIVEFKYTTLQLTN